MMYPKEKYIQLRPMVVLIIFMLVILFFTMKRYYSEYSLKQKLTAGMIVNTRNELRTMSINVMFAAAKTDKKLPRDINSLIDFMSTHLNDWERMRNEELRNYFEPERDRLVDSWHQPVRLKVISAEQYVFISSGPNRKFEDGKGDDLKYTFNPYELKEEKK